MLHKLINIMAYKQNWAKLTPWLGIITAFLLFKFIDYKDVRFWALVNIPLYLFHQMEEHYLPGGFKNYVNQVVNKLPPQTWLGLHTYLLFCTCFSLL